jgi:molybdopterin-guanine dinucleotide biosynthesis protein A
MEHAAFVLAGGRSTRMGRDKALLPWNEGKNGGTLLGHVASLVRQAAGNVTVIGHDAYLDLGFDVVPDTIPNCGPLGGLLTAFQVSTADRVLLVACDMPNLTPELLRGLMQHPGDAVVAQSGGRLHPLCAVYHRKLQPQVAAAVQKRSLKMHDFLSTIQIHPYPVQEADLLKNLNTPEDFAA